MITTNELQEYPGLTILSSSVSEVSFSVKVSAITKGISGNLLLNVVCPVVGQNLLLIQSKVSCSSTEIEIPLAWKSNNIESTIANNLMTVRRAIAFKAEASAKVRKEESQRDKKENLKQHNRIAIETYNLEIDEKLSLQDFLMACGQAYSDNEKNS